MHEQCHSFWRSGHRQRRALRIDMLDLLRDHDEFCDRLDGSVCLPRCRVSRGELQILLCPKSLQGWQLGEQDGPSTAAVLFDVQHVRARDNIDVHSVLLTGNVSTLVAES